MSLEDELNEVTRKKPNVEQWVESWLKSLPAKDRKTWGAAVSDPNVPSTALYRVLCRHGFQHKITSFKEWLRIYRESLG